MKNSVRFVPKDEILSEARNEEIGENTVLFTSISYTNPTDEENDALFYIEDLEKVSSFILDNFSNKLYEIINDSEIFSLLRIYIMMWKDNVYPDQEPYSEEIISLIKKKFDKK